MQPHAEKAKKYLEACVTEHLKDPGLQRITEGLLREDRFFEVPASTSWHHIYEGGLAVHTAEVTLKALQLTQEAAYPFYEVDCETLVTAAIWHDYAKIHEVALKNGVYVHTPYRHKIRHVAGSYAAFMGAVWADGGVGGRVEEIGHCILSHHGRLEWGSPIEPWTTEARILHQADAWSAGNGPDSVWNLEIP